MSHRSRLALALLLLAYMALAAGYALANPLYESTDELRHFRYVRHIAVHRSLPVQQAGAPRAQSHHPPLYYLFGALVSGWVPVEQDVYYAPAKNPFWAYRYWEVGVDNKAQYLHGLDERFPFRGVALAVYLVRWLTVIAGAGVVWLTFLIGREVFPSRPVLALGGATLVAFNPQFLYLSGAVNNDIPAALCAAGVLLACVRLVRRGPTLRTDVVLGVLLGLALLTKFNLLALLGVVGLAYALGCWGPRVPRAGRLLVCLRGIAIVLILAALISGWWFLRNWRLYGDPTGLNRVNELWAGRSAADGWWPVRQGLPYLWTSLWGRFGYGQLPLPPPVYRGLLVLCGLGLIGYLRPPWRVLPWKLVVLLAGTSLIFVAVVLYYMLIQPAGAMGRFLFPGLPALATLLFIGLTRYLPGQRVQHRAWMVSLVVVAGLFALAAYALVGALVPAFAPPPPLTAAELQDVPNPTTVQFESVAQLVGYEVRPATVEPGGNLTVTVYWQPLARTQQPYAVFVHLLSEVGTMVAQRDTYPGLGRYPTTIWEPDRVFKDVYRVTVPETAYAPDAAFVQVGLYLPDGPRLVTVDGSDAVRLADVDIRPRAGRFPNPLQANFNGEAALVGYALDRRVVRPGETIRLTLYWQALAPMDENYSVIAHVLGAENQVWARNTGWPVDGDVPTSTWEPGQVVEDIRDLTVGLTTPPSFYDIEVALYNDQRNDRLPIVAEDGHWLDDRVLLGRILVMGDE